MSRAANVVLTITFKIFIGRITCKLDTKTLLIAFAFFIVFFTFFQKQFI